MCALGFFSRILPQNQRHRAGLAGAGGAQNGKVLAQQVVDLDHRGNARILLDMTNADRAVMVGGVRHGQFVLRGARNHVAKARIRRHATAEALGIALVVLGQFTNELHLDDAHFLRSGSRATGSAS